jgi:hypothetical protein
MRHPTKGNEGNASPLKTRIRAKDLGIVLQKLTKETKQMANRFGKALQLLEKRVF